MLLLFLPQGKLPALPGQRPNMGDWENHLTTIFPEVSWAWG
jgi:gamma-glutamylcysteine synthetase